MPANTQAVGAPGATNDSGQGYAAGSIWRNVTDGAVYVCTAATAGAAVWEKVSVNASSRTLPVDADAAVVRAPMEVGILDCIHKELRTIRLILSVGFNLPMNPEDIDAD